MPKGLLELSVEQGLIRSEINSAQRQKAQETVDALSAAMDEYRTAAAHINNNGRLTPEGKAGDLAVLKESTNSRISQIGDSRLESLDRRIAELEILVRPQQQDGDPMIELLKQQEIRALFMVHPDFSDELELTAHYQSLAVSGESDLTMRAIENAPLPLISDPAILAAGRAARGERTNAESALTLRQLKSVRSTIAATINGFRAELQLPDLTIQNIAEGTAA